jgi:DNA-binding NtrC family response regulator
MPFFGPQRPIVGSMVATFGNVATWSVRNKLLLAIVPLVALMLAITGYATRYVSGRYLSMALERTTKVLTMGQADALADTFEQARQDLLLLARSTPAEANAQRLPVLLFQIRHGVYREIAYISAGAETADLHVDTGREVCRIPKDLASRVVNSPLMAPSKLGEARVGSVMFLGLSESIYPPGVLPGSNAGMTLPLFRLVTPVAGENGKINGYWVLAVDGRAARDVLSLYNSPRSPLSAFPRTAFRRYSFFFDNQGWMLFQSGNIEEPELPLSTDVARMGLSGDHGMPGTPGAFRPSVANEAYWRMVVDVQGGRAGIENVSAGIGLTDPGHDNYSLGYAPVTFKSHPDRPADVVGGVAFMDMSRLLLAADYRIYDVLLVVFICALALTAGCIILLSRVITRPMLNLAAAVRAMPQEGGLKPIVLPDKDKETTIMRESINHMVEAILYQREELRLKDAHIQDHLRRQPLDLDEKLLGVAGHEPIEGIIGTSQAMRDVKWLIRKAASVDPDVLIIGETGTGKEVTAQAIHKLSRRSSGPFISINCGALDENLLLDALFGHVRGAFSEAKTDRKGAFLTAQGGTILLDEIGNASPKVQQALLRALAARTIIPLGSDMETPFDARVIAATNVELLECVQAGTFREDLYYRLKVLTLHTPPLRDRMEDIPALVDAFIKDSAKVMHKPRMTLSRGAWERIAAHEWPGNVRELKHCLMRAVAMADSEIILEEDLRFDPKAHAATPGDIASRLPERNEDRLPGTGAFPSDAIIQPSGSSASASGADRQFAGTGRNPAGPGAANAAKGRRSPKTDGRQSAAQGRPDGNAAQSYPPEPERNAKAGGISPAASRDRGTQRDGSQAARDIASSTAAPGNAAHSAWEDEDLRGLNLNERQLAGVAYLRLHGDMSRAQYQSVVGANVPPRTAQYDLRDMVEQGMLHVRGKGPATRYVLTGLRGLSRKTA